MQRQARADSSLQAHLAGFALVELLVVIAVIGILAALAIPQYQIYLARAQFAEGYMLASGLKAGVVEVFSETGRCPDNSNGSTWRIPAAVDVSGRYVESVTTGMGGHAAEGIVTTDWDLFDGSGFFGITARFRTAGVSKGIAGQTVELSMYPMHAPSGSGMRPRGALTWRCVSRVDKRYIPIVCASYWDDVG